jgi:hypothetical protein
MAQASPSCHPGESYGDIHSSPSWPFTTDDTSRARFVPTATRQALSSLLAHARSHQHVDRQDRHHRQRQQQQGSEAHGAS